MASASSSIARLRTPSATDFRTVKWLVGVYVGLSTLTVAAIITFSAVAPGLVNPQAQVRGIIVAATSLLSFVFASRAARGDTRALLRLRIVVAIVIVAVIAVLFFVPLPSWMVVEQAACGAVLAAVAVIILRPSPNSPPRRPALRRPTPVGLVDVRRSGGLRVGVPAQQRQVHLVDDLDEHVVRRAGDPARDDLVAQQREGHRGDPGVSGLGWRLPPGDGAVEDR